MTLDIRQDRDSLTRNACMMSFYFADTGIVSMVDHDARIVNCIISIRTAVCHIGERWGATAVPYPFWGFFNTSAIRSSLLLLFVSFFSFYVFIISISIIAIIIIIIIIIIDIARRPFLRVWNRVWDGVWIGVWNAMACRWHPWISFSRFWHVAICSMYIYIYIYTNLEPMCWVAW